MDFPGIEAFLAVVRMQSISKAAEHLNLAQSTVSKRLQVLEDALGVILFERKKGNHPLRLTEAGERLLEPAERCRILQTELENLHLAAPEYRLAIGSLDSLNYAVFPRLFHALSEHRPRIMLKVITSHSLNLYELLETRQIDVGFTLLKREHPFLVVEPYHADPVVGICLMDAPYSSKTPIHPQSLSPDNELYVDWGANFRNWHAHWWESSHKGRIVLDTAQLIFSFFHNREQWAGVPLSVGKSIQRSAPGHYRIFHFSPAPQDRICYKITHARAKASTQAVIRIMDGYFVGNRAQEALVPSGPGGAV